MFIPFAGEEKMSSICIAGRIWQMSRLLLQTTQRQNRYLALNQTSASPDKWRQRRTGDRGSIQIQDDSMNGLALLYLQIRLFFFGNHTGTKGN